MFVAWSEAAVAGGLSGNGIEEKEEEIIKQVMSKECRGQYNSHCLKLNLLRMVSRAGSGAFSILPGVSLSWTRPHLDLEPAQLEDQERLDTILLDQLGDTLSNISLSVKILDREAPLSFAKAYLGESAFTGRRRKDRYGGALAAAGLMSGGTMLAVGLSALAAMAGKALMASLLALMLAGISALKGNGEDSKTTYEIVAKPVVSHQHTHSSEVIHGGHHYKRSIPAQHMAYMMQIPK
ncbi:uncharacterized protein [Halyomorpha halys]|uniref:uncharacterized protein isoform X1 n=1 Tax=Halyomorpha halys TaxID=286706 RepID=UPI000D0C824F|nr:uncharacterized protein LOC106684979 isoform X1 [Halyomorpha halys]